MNTELTLFEQLTIWLVVINISLLLDTTPTTTEFTSTVIILLWSTLRKKLL